MIRIPRMLAVGLASFLLVSPLSAAPDLDLYVLYAGRDSKDKNDLNAQIGKLSGDIEVKNFNVDLLALADYSGKQKAIARFGRARLVVAVKDGPQRVLKGSRLSSDLVITRSTRKTLRSRKRTLYIVAKGTDLSKLGKRIKTVHIATEKDLQNAEAILSADVAVIDPSLDFYGATAKILQALLEAQEE